jgi:hypothetical protein
MRDYALAIALVALALSGTAARADFQFRSERSAITFGMFTGDDLFELDVMNDGHGGSGTTLLSATVTLSSTDPNGVFFIRTYDADGTGMHNGGSPSSDPTDNDFDASGLGGESPLGTYVRFGPPSQWTIAGSDPEFLSSDDPGFQNEGPGPGGPGINYPPSGKYTDGMALKGPITVIGGTNIRDVGLPDTTFQPLAFAVVPHNEPVEFSVQATGSPEPASLGLVAIGAAALLARRRRG